MEELVRDGQVWDVFGKELPSDSESGCGTRRKQDGRATRGLGIRKKTAEHQGLAHHSL